MNDRLWVVAYDIADPKRLARVARILEHCGERAQKSVFECWLNPRELDELQTEIREATDAAADSVRYYPLCAWCSAAVAWQGSGGTAMRTDYYVV